MVRSTQHERRVALLCVFRKVYVFGIVIYRNVFLGFFNEKHLRNKDSSIKLETYLV